MIQPCFANFLANASKRIAIFCTLSLLVALSITGFAQKRTDRSNNTSNTSKTGAAGPKRTDRTVPESERVKVITKTEFVRVAVNPNKGYLSLVAIPKAAITLTPVAASSKKATPVIPIKEVIKDPDGSLNLINLLPGKYKLTIEHENYQPFAETIQVDPANPTTFVALNKMISLYGEIRIGGILSGSKVLLDEKPPALVQENQAATIAKIPVGKHRLKISKDGYVELNREIEVLPGKEQFVSAQLELAMVTVSLSSQPGARVYAGSVEKGVFPSDGKMTISLPPGRHSIRVLKEGFQEWTKELSLTMANTSVAERIELAPVSSSAEGDWQPSLAARKWFPQTTGWKFENSGALIRGDKPVLFDTESGRDFNTYRDFKLEFDFVFTNGKGLAWVVRAKDLNNYYLFEISSPQNSPTFHFYICRDGKLEWKDSQRIVEKMDKKGDSFHITFEAKGNRFDTRMTIASAPSAKPHLIGIFQDDSFSYGGVGFRGKDASESLLQTFFVIPLR